MWFSINKIFFFILAAFDEKKLTEAKTERKTGQHPADDRDSDDEMETEAKKPKTEFKKIVNEVSDFWINQICISLYT